MGKKHHNLEVWKHALDFVATIRKSETFKIRYSSLTNWRFNSFHGGRLRKC